MNLLALQFAESQMKSRQSNSKNNENEFDIPVLNNKYMHTSPNMLMTYYCPSSQKHFCVCGFQQFQQCFNKFCKICSYAPYLSYWQERIFQIKKDGLRAAVLHRSTNCLQLTNYTSSDYKQVFIRGC